MAITHYLIFKNHISLLPDTPKGKRTIRTNIYGNIVGYVSGKRFWEFGMDIYTNRVSSKLWQDGASLAEALRG